MPRYIRRQPGYVLLGELAAELGLHTTARLRNDIKAGVLPAERLPSTRKNEPYLIKVADAEHYKKTQHTPQPVQPVHVA